MVTSTDTVGIGYHCQEQPAHPRIITTMGDDHHTLSTLQVDVMTGEAAADPMLGYTRETEVQVTQDTPAQTGTPAGTETQDRDTHWTATKPRADHPTSNNRPPTPYARHNSRSRSSSHNNDKLHRHNVTIQDNPADNEDQDYNNVDDYFNEDLN